jgi:hypothetical protein
MTTLQQTTNDDGLYLLKNIFGHMMLGTPLDKKIKIISLQNSDNELVDGANTNNNELIHNKNDNELNKLTTNFYEENDPCDYLEHHVIYLAYIGIYNGKHILQFGASSDYPRQNIYCKKTYKTYNVIKIWPTLANYVIEKKIKTEMKAKKILTKEIIGGKPRTKLIALNEIYTLDKCVGIINKIVSKTKSVYDLENEKIVYDLTMANKKLSNERDLLKKKIELLELRCAQHHTK